MTCLFKDGSFPWLSEIQLFNPMDYLLIKGKVTQARSTRMQNEFIFPSSEEKHHSHLCVVEVLDILKTPKEILFLPHLFKKIVFLKILPSSTMNAENP